MVCWLGLLVGLLPAVADGRLLPDIRFFGFWRSLHKVAELKNGQVTFRVDDQARFVKFKDFDKYENNLTYWSGKTFYSFDPLLDSDMHVAQKATFQLMVQGWARPVAAMFDLGLKKSARGKWVCCGVKRRGEAFMQALIQTMAAVADFGALEGRENLFLATNNNPDVEFKKALAGMENNKEKINLGVELEKALAGLEVERVRSAELKAPNKEKINLGVEFEKALAGLEIERERSAELKAPYFGGEVKEWRLRRRGLRKWSWEEALELSQLEVKMGIYWWVATVVSRGQRFDEKLAELLASNYILEVVDGRRALDYVFFHNMAKQAGRGWKFVPPPSASTAAVSFEEFLWQTVKEMKDHKIVNDEVIQLPDQEKNLMSELLDAANRW